MIQPVLSETFWARLKPLINHLDDSGVAGVNIVLEPGQPVAIHLKLYADRAALKALDLTDLDTANLTIEPTP